MVKLKYGQRIIDLVMLFPFFTVVIKALKRAMNIEGQELRDRKTTWMEKRCTSSVEYIRAFDGGFAGKKMCRIVMNMRTNKIKVTARS